MKLYLDIIRLSCVNLYRKYNLIVRQKWIDLTLHWLTFRSISEILSYERIDDLMSLLTISFEHIHVLWEHPRGHNAKFTILGIWCVLTWRTWCGLTRREGCRSCGHTLIYYNNTNYRLEHGMCDLDTWYRYWRKKIIKNIIYMDINPSKLPLYMNIDINRYYIHLT